MVLHNPSPSGSGTTTHASIVALHPSVSHVCAPQYTGGDGLPYAISRRLKLLEVAQPHVEVFQAESGCILDEAMRVQAPVAETVSVT